MKRTIRAILAGLALSAALAGCAGNPAFVYRPAPLTPAGRALPLAVAVLPFEDGTEDFRTRGAVFGPQGLTVNLVKAGIPGSTSALTPELWAKAFADDLAASGAFRSVRFAFDPSELSGEAVRIDGTVAKAYAIGTWDRPNEIVLRLKATRTADRRTLWEKEVAQRWTPRLILPCGLTGQCVTDQKFADLNRVMRALFAEARADLVRTLASDAGNAPPDERLPEETGGDASPEPAADAIRDILKGN